MNLQNMAPNAKRSMLLTFVFAGLAVCVYLFGLGPTETSLTKLRRELTERTQEHQRMKADFADTQNVKARLAELDAKLKVFHDVLLEPLLESYAMRAKSLVEPLALGAGLSELQFEAQKRRSLPWPVPTPAQRYARCPIRVTAVGSYQAAVSFLLRLEKEMPLVGLAALDIATRRTPDQQQIEFILEWPVREEASK